MVGQTNQQHDLHTPSQRDHIHIINYMCQTLPPSLPRHWWPHTMGGGKNTFGSGSQICSMAPIFGMVGRNPSVATTQSAPWCPNQRPKFLGTCSFRDTTPVHLKSPHLSSIKEQPALGEKNFGFPTMFFFLRLHSQTFRVGYNQSRSVRKRLSSLHVHTCSTYNFSYFYSSSFILSNSTSPAGYLFVSIIIPEFQ